MKNIKLNSESIVQILTRIYLVIQYIVAVIWFTGVLLWLILITFWGLFVPEAKSPEVSNFVYIMIVYFITFAILLILSIKALYRLLNKENTTIFQKISLILMPIIELLSVLLFFVCK